MIKYECFMCGAIITDDIRCPECGYSFTAGDSMDVEEVKKLPNKDNSAFWTKLSEDI